MLKNTPLAFTQATKNKILSFCENKFDTIKDLFKINNYQGAFFHFDMLRKLKGMVGKSAEKKYNEALEFI